MAKNPVAVNDGGLFRFVDFMNYVPDFLKEEGDVVTLMQLFSDYLNNAYRNIDDSTRFTFNYFATESTVDSVKSRVEDFASKLAACDNNNLYVHYLSLPRTNANYNTTVELPYIKNAIYYAGEFADRLPLGVFAKLMKENPNGDRSQDGDVIYVRYKDDSVYPYYIDKTDNLLILDPNRTSQDPFKGTMNVMIDGAPRVVKFIPKNVGDVTVSSVGQINDANVYDVKFDLTIDDVENAPSKYRESNGNDTIEVDLYKYSGNADKVYIDNAKHADIFKWIDGTPTGMFYFKELHEFIDGEKSYIYQEYRIEILEFIADERSPYRSNLGYLTLSGVPNLNVGDRFSIDSDEVVGTSGGINVTLAGTYSVETEPCGNVLKIRFNRSIDVDPGMPMVKIMTSRNRLYRYGISYSRLGYDYSKTTPKVEWDHAESIRPELASDGDTVYPCTVRANCKIGELRFENLYSYAEDPNDPEYYTGVSPKNFVEVPESVQIVSGNHYYFEYRYDGTEPQAWRDAFDDVFDNPLASYSVSDGRAYFRKLEGNGQLKFPSMGSRVSASDAKSLVVDVYAMESAMGIYTPDADSTDLVVYSDIVPEVGDVCLMTKIELADAGLVRTPCSDLYIVRRCELVDPVAAKYHVWFDKDVPEISDGMFDVSFLNVPGDKSRAVLEGVDNDNSMAKCRYRYGDIYTCDYWMPADGSYALKCAYKDAFGDVMKVSRYVAGKGYNTGDMIYWSPTDSVYRVVKPISGGETEGDLIDGGSIVPYMFTVADIGRKPIYNDDMFGIFRTIQIDYGERLDLGGYVALKDVVNRLFIEKANDNRLVFGWKDRDFLMNMATYNTEGKARTGFCEFYTTYGENDIVLKNMENYSVAKTIPGEGVNLKGLANTVSVSAKKFTAEQTSTGSYVVRVTAPRHNLPDGSKVRISGADNPQKLLDFNTPDYGFDAISVVDKDTFTYNRTSDCEEPLVVSYGNATVTGYRDIYNPITGIDYYLIPPSGGKYNAGYLYIHTAYPHGYSTYTKVTVLNSPTGGANSGWIGSAIGANRRVDVVVDERVYGIKLDRAHVPLNGSQWLHYGSGISGSDNLLEHSYSMVSPEDGDVVNVGGTYYKVGVTEWRELTGDTIDTPFYLYSHQNIMDITSTNPTSARGDDNLIESISFDGNDTVTVVVHNGMDLVANKSCVYISSVYPLEFNGRYVVDSVVSPRMFTYKVSPKSIPASTGVAVSNTTMTCVEGKWFKYLVSEVMVNRKSTYEIFKYGKAIVDSVAEKPSENYVETEIPHGYEEGTRLVLYVSGNYYNAVVSSVINDKAFLYEFADGSRTLDVLGGYAFRGVYVPENGHVDDIEPIGLYKQRLNCIDAEYEFREGDVVFAYDNLRTDMPNRYIVKKGIWTPCVEKRVMKIKKIDVDRYRNNEWDGASTEDVVDEYVYRPYSYPEVERMVAEDIDDGLSSYIMPFHIRNYNFASPYVENIDTTEQPMPQFDSKHDYASVAPRFDMEDAKFKGIPDMKYPLVEKLERLIYLRDANVIDYELIGYLARFMGYDITDAKNDVESNRMYSTREAREKAVRETVSNLPQYYALGGTKAGLEMLMETFGIVAEVITMWTNADRPYGELIEEDQVVARENEDYERGTISKWVPTPHVKVKFRSDANFDNGAVAEAKIGKLIKNIKCFKPIQVVFDDFIKYLDLPHGKMYVNGVSFVNSGKASAGVNYDVVDDESEACCDVWGK